MKAFRAAVVLLVVAAACAASASGEAGVGAELSAFVRNTGRSIYNGVTGFVSGEHQKLTEMVQSYFDSAAATKRRLVETVMSARTDRPKANCTVNIAEVHLTTPQLAALHGYPAESHTIRTADGYLLTAHRIPCTRNLPRGVSPKTVLLHHGLLGSSADWVLAGPTHSLAYLLSDVGYDVWMANARGNVYSRAHVFLEPDSYAFWNFTWHDIAQHDLPALIDYIHTVKGADSKINYVGHSMGTTVLFALLSTKPQYNRRLRAGFALAPVAYMSDVKSPIRLLAPFSHDIEKLMRLLGANEFLPQNWVLRWLSEHACEINKYEEAICENSLFVLCGHDEKQFNRTLLPIILGHVPAGASTKTLVHYAQEIHSGGRFQQFDYGRDGNIRQYGTEMPPEYQIANITLPIALLSARNDWLAGEVDVSILYAALPLKLEHYVVPLKDFNHIDFLWAIDAPRLVYAKLITMMKNLEIQIDSEMTSRSHPAMPLQWVGLR